MEGAKQAHRLTDERIASSSCELRMHLCLRLICSFLCTPPSKEVFRQKTIKHLGMDLSMTYDGITPLKFISKDSLLNLKDACETRKIEDFLQCLFVESKAADGLGRGKVKFKIYMCKMSPEEYGLYIQGNMTEERENEEQKMLWWFVEELDPSRLFKDLRKLGLVEENDKVQVMNCIPRKKQMEFLIGKLAVSKRNEMFSILLVHCMKHDNQFLKDKINAILSGNTGKRVKEERLSGTKIFVADFRISIQESTGALKVDIQNRKWLLDIVEAKEEDIVIMELIPEGELTEEEAITTESHDANEKSHQNKSTLDSSRTESLEVDQIDSKQGDNSCNNSNTSQNDLAHVAGIDTDKSLNDQDGVIYQRQQPVENSSDFSVSSEMVFASEAEGSIRISQNTRRVDASTGKWHSKILNHYLIQMVRHLDVRNVCIQLQQREVLDEVTVRDILEQTTTTDKILELIKHIRQRDHDTYETFKECLVVAKQAFLKDKLEEEEAKFAK